MKRIYIVLFFLFLRFFISIADNLTIISIIRKNPAIIWKFDSEF